MVDQTLKNLRGESRRHFLKFASAAGALLALDRSEVLNVIADSGGHALAQAASCSETNRSIHLVAGDGGFAWFQLLFPHNGIAAGNNDQFAFHAFGETEIAADTDKPFTFAPETPWRAHSARKRVTALMAGSNETHTPQPDTAATLGNGVGMLAASAALQGELPSLLPVIGVTPFNFGLAAGAPAVTTVGSPDAMVDLFNSSASRALLSVPENAETYEAYYKAFLSLNRAAPRSTWQRQLRIGKASADFLGKNLAALLMPTAEDLERYGVGPGAPGNLRDLGYGLAVAARAFRLGLTNCVILPALRDDPHGAFNDMANLRMRLGILGQMLDAVMDDLDASPDPACSGKTLADSTIFTIHGDTPKTPRDRNAWPDGTPGNSNWIYVMGNGYLKTGWFGGITPNEVYGFDPATGQDVLDKPSTDTSASAAAAVLYAITQGDIQRVNRFYSGPSLAGIVNEQIL
jgi:hypothetical protein